MDDVVHVCAGRAGGVYNARPANASSQGSSADGHGNY